MLTRRAKAYSSSCSQIQTVSLSPAILTWLLRGYRSLMPSCAGFLEPKKSRMDHQNLPSMPKISYAASPCLSQLVSAHCTLEICLAAWNRQKIRKNPYFSIQGHPRSLNSVAIKSQCTTSY